MRTVLRKSLIGGNEGRKLSWPEWLVAYQEGIILVSDHTSRY